MREYDMQVTSSKTPTRNRACAHAWTLALLVQPAKEEEPAPGRGEAVVVAGRGRGALYLGAEIRPLQRGRVQLVQVVAERHCRVEESHSGFVRNHFDPTGSKVGSSQGEKAHSCACVGARSRRLAIVSCERPRRHSASLDRSYPGLSSFLLDLPYCAFAA